NVLFRDVGISGMAAFLYFLAAHWLPAAVAGAGVVLALARWRRRPTAAPLLVLAAALGLAGAGGLTLPPEWGGWVLAGAAGAFGLMLVVLLVSGAWWAPLAWAVAAAACVGFGAWTLPATGAALVEGARALVAVEFVRPWWLLLLLLVPVVF